jgi:hypothetical protein
MRIPTLISRSNGEYREVYVEDVFSTYVYTGTGAATRDITNGVDLDGKGGLVWTKCRSASYGNVLHDNEMSPETFLSSDISGGIYGGNTGADTYLSLNSDGYSIGDSQYVNESSREYTSWTFAKDKGFFDVVTYTGTGASQTIPHNLKSAPGMIIVKATNSNFDWVVYHKSMGDYANFYNEFGYLASSNSLYVKLNDTGSVTQSDIAWDNTDPTASGFTVGGDGRTGASGVEYVAYLFADDDPIFGTGEDESVIKCGGYTGNGSTTGPEIDLGWEPQWILIKGVNSSAAYDWKLYDAMRGIPVGTGDAVLQPNKSDIEETNQDNVDITPTGFKLTNAALATNKSGQGYIYMAIRRPHKPASKFEPDELFSTVLGDNSGGDYPHGFPVDMAWSGAFAAAAGVNMTSRLTGDKYFAVHSTNAASSSSNVVWDSMDGHGANAGTSLQSWGFRRAPEFVDVVTYYGTGSVRTQEHNLGVVPEMMWIKRLDTTVNWAVYHKDVHPNIGNLDQDWLWGASSGTFNNTVPSSSVITLGSGSYSNTSGGKYIAFLFATVPGVSKVGSYTGTGGSLDIDCGFTNGARFVMVKRTDAFGGWFFWDSLRGIVAGDESYLVLNDTAMPVTADHIDPYSAGFNLTGSESAINGSGGNFIFYAIA